MVLDLVTGGEFVLPTKGIKGAEAEQPLAPPGALPVAEGILCGPSVAFVLWVLVPWDLLSLWLGRGAFLVLEETCEETEETLEEELDIAE